MKRDMLGRFAGGLFPLSRRRKVLLAGMVVCAVVPLAGKALEYVRPGELVAHRAEAAELPMISTVDEMKADVLDRLAECENPKGKPIVFDTNGVASVGQYQWQPHSFQHYWEKMTGIALSEKEAVIYALDDAKARRLAEYVIFETDKGPGKDWINCSRWHDLETLVAFIKAHE